MRHLNAALCALGAVEMVAAGYLGGWPDWTLGPLAAAGAALTSLCLAFAGDDDDPDGWEGA